MYKSFSIKSKPLSVSSGQIFTSKSFNIYFVLFFKSIKNVLIKNFFHILHEFHCKIANVQQVFNKYSSVIGICALLIRTFLMFQECKYFYKNSS